MKRLKFKYLLFLAAVLTVLYAINSCTYEEADADESEISTIKKLPASHKTFIAEFYPKVVEANKKVMLDRARLIDLRNDYRYVIIRGIRLNWLNNLAEKYKYGEAFFDRSISKDEYKNRIDSLLWRVDKIPEKLIMAQAIIESGWGNSKFARQVNNYFGIHCYSPDCGPSPSAVENPKFYVKSFETVQDCIEEYLWVLNTGFAYEGLRQKRHELREEGNYPNALAMADGLKRYSEKGSDYITLVHTIITNYLPGSLQAFVDYQNREFRYGSPDQGM